MKKTAAAVALTSLLLSACGNAPSSAGPTAGVSGSAAPISSSTASPAASASSSPAAPASPSASPSAVPSPSASPSPTASAQPQPAGKTYKMNKNYDIVPIDPNGNAKVVLLTFDDGPKELSMNEGLLAALDKHKAKAIFFENGYRIKTHPELVKLLHDRGQIIGNHSWDHIDLKKESNAKIDQQVGDVQKIVKDTIGSSPQFFRPPYGSGSDYLREKVKQENMLYMTWSNGSLDWALPANTKDKSQAIIDNVMKQLHKGSNILMHELPWTVDTLDRLLTELEAKGYSFVDPNSIDTTAQP